MMKPWNTRARRTLLNHSKYLTIEEHIVELPDGTLIENWPWVKSPDYILTLACTNEGKFLCFKQTKYAVKGETFAPVGGYLEEGENPIEGAKRELLEETGYEAQEWKSLGSYPTSGNHWGGMAHLFFADKAVKVCEPNRDDLEEMELLEFTPDEMRNALMNGEFKVVSWSALVAMTLLYVENTTTKTGNPTS